MKGFCTLAILGTLILGSGAALASSLEDQAYDEGWDAASEFCLDVEAGHERIYARRNITERFERNCKQGFDAYINHNRTCKRKLENAEDGYRRMWQARRESCS